MLSCPEVEVNQLRVLVLVKGRLSCYRLHGNGVSTVRSCCHLDSRMGGSLLLIVHFYQVQIIWEMLVSARQLDQGSECIHISTMKRTVFYIQQYKTELENI